MSSISAGTTSTTTLVHSGDTTGSLVFKTNDTGSGGTTAVTIDTSQNVGIGTSSITNPQGWGKVVQITNSGSSGLYLNDGTANWSVAAYAGKMWFTSDANTRMLIDSSGNLLLNGTSVIGLAKQTTVFNGAAENGLSLKTTYSTTNGSGFALFFAAGGGQIGSITQASSTTVAYNTSSDYRLKENITPLTNGLSKVMALKPSKWTWKTFNDYGEGFIAHELADVCPEAVTGAKDAVDAEGNPKYQGVDTSFLVATLTAAIQEQQALITAQAETINALTARVVALESK